MSYTITFNKPDGNDYTSASYQDRITDNIWFTRLNVGGPLFNYKYYLDNSLIPGTENQFKNLIADDFWYEDTPNSQGGTRGVKWAILSSLNFPDLNASGINSSLFGTLGNPTNFFSFSQMCTLLTAMINNSSKPISLIDPNNNNDWLLQNASTQTGTDMTLLENKKLGCYIPSTNQYFEIMITTWGYDGNTTIEYQRTELFDGANICFPKGTLVNTDQGRIPIEKIKPEENTISNKKIIGISKTVSKEKKLVCLEKNSLGFNIPSERTLISLEHKILFNNYMVPAKKLIGFNRGIHTVDYKGEILYNVLMNTSDNMIVNNMIVETLDPNNVVSKNIRKNINKNILNKNQLKINLINYIINQRRNNLLCLKTSL